MPTLYLTTAEQTQLETLPADLRAKVAVETESLTFIDTDQDRDSRMHHLTLKDPLLKEYQEKAKTVTMTPEELMEEAQKIDLSSISKDDVIELAFAWGPDVFTALIGEAIPAVKTAQDLQEIADLTDIRHGLLLSFTR